MKTLTAVGFSVCLLWYSNALAFINPALVTSNITSLSEPPPALMLATDEGFCLDMLVQTSDLLYRILDVNPEDPSCRTYEKEYHSLQSLYDQLCRKESNSKAAALSMCGGSAKR
jgi:hypothetical protein